jgi:hypothetical protein
MAFHSRLLWGLVPLEFEGLSNLLLHKHPDFVQAHDLSHACVTTALSSHVAVQLFPLQSIDAPAQLAPWQVNVHFPMRSQSTTTFLHPPASHTTSQGAPPEHLTVMSLH